MLHLDLFRALTLPFVPAQAGTQGHRHGAYGSGSPLSRGRAEKAAVVLAMAAFLLALLPPVVSAQQTWPVRPVTMVVPFAAGGPMDTVGRIMAQGLSEQLGQSVVVENVGG